MPFGQRGKPFVKTPTTRRGLAIFKLPAAMFADPNQVLGDKPGTKARDPKLIPQQAPLQLREQMVDQVKMMARTSVLKQQKEAAAAGAAAVLVLTEVSIQEDLARMQSELQGILRALKGPPEATSPLATRVSLRTL